MSGCTLEVRTADCTLEILDALPRPEEEAPFIAPLRLRLAPGHLALIEARVPGMARALTELAVGLPALASGTVRFLGRDWHALARRDAEALRGCIGIAPGEGGWLPHLPVSASMLLAARHHGRADPVETRRHAEALARHFGLDSVPEATPHEVPDLDLARAGCVRAFLRKPALLLLESPFDLAGSDQLVAPLRAMLAAALAEGAAAIWCTPSRLAWEDQGAPAARRFRLDAEGLVPA